MQAALYNSGLPPTIFIICLVLIILHTQQTGGGGLGHPHGAVHMVAARLGCKWAVVGTGWANSHPVCMNGLRKRYSHLVGGSIPGRVLCTWWLLGCKRGNGWHRVEQFSPWLHEQRGEPSPGRKAALVTCVVSSWSEVMKVEKIIMCTCKCQIGLSKVECPS